jgi:hypothetical protein
LGKAEFVLSEIQVPDRNEVLAGNVGLWAMECDRGGPKRQYGGPLTIKLDGKKVSFQLELDTAFGASASMLSTPGVALIAGEGFLQGQLVPNTLGPGLAISSTGRTFQFEEKNGDESRTVTIAASLGSLSFYLKDSTTMKSGAGHFGVETTDQRIPFNCSGSWATGPTGLRRN